MRKLDKILLVDDDEVNNFINEALLEELEIAEEVVVLTNGRLALDYIIEHCSASGTTCPALVIFDYHMPVMDGMEFIEAFRQLALPHQEKIIFLLLGVDAHPKDIEAFMKLGVHEYTPKPLSKGKVMEVCNQYLNTAAGEQ